MPSTRTLERHEAVAQGRLLHRLESRGSARQRAGCRRRLERHPDVIVVDVSSVYETEPVGGPPTVRNSSTSWWSRRPPFRTLVERAFAIEDAFGRTRGGERWGPRTLDVDLIMVGNAVVDQEDLKLPHPLAHERASLLVPWYEVDPTAEIAGKGDWRPAQPSGRIRRGPAR